MLMQELTQIPMKTAAQIERRRRHHRRQRARRKATRLAARLAAIPIKTRIRRRVIRFLKKTIGRTIKKYGRKFDCMLFSRGMHRLRYRVWRRDHHTCQLCNCHVHKLKSVKGEDKAKAKAKVDTGEVHHIESQTEHPHLRYQIDNCVLLCHECHKLADWVNLIQRQEQEPGQSVRNQPGFRERKLVRTDTTIDLAATVAVEA